MKQRRGPWLTGLIVALGVTIWMVGQVMGGVLAMTGYVLSPFPAGPTPDSGVVGFNAPPSQ
ncbi:hypothetical protein [Mycobacterium sp. URHB0021]